MALTDYDKAALREQALSHYDQLEMALQPAVDRGDPEAIRTAARIAADRGRLLGLVPPIRITVGRREELPAAIAQALAELDARADDNEEF